MECFTRCLLPNSRRFKCGNSLKQCGVHERMWMWLRNNNKKKNRDGATKSKKYMKKNNGRFQLSLQRIWRLLVRYENKLVNTPAFSLPSHPSNRQQTTADRAFNFCSQGYQLLSSVSGFLYGFCVCNCVVCVYVCWNGVGTRSVRYTECMQWESYNNLSRGYTLPFNHSDWSMSIYICYLSLSPSLSFYFFAVIIFSLQFKSSVDVEMGAMNRTNAKSLHTLWAKCTQMECIYYNFRG